MRRILTLAEPVLLLIVAVVAPLLAGQVLDGGFLAAALRGEVGDAAVIQAKLQTAQIHFALGGLALIVPRVVSLYFRRGNHILTPFSLPAAYAALGLGFALQVGYGSPFASTWPGPAFALGVLYAGIAAAVVLSIPGDIGRILAQARWVLLGLALLMFLLLGAYGLAPGRSGQTINLWGFQPVELIKVCVALSVGAILGGRAWKLRWHRDQVGPLRLPRLRLLALALGTMLVAWLGLFAIKDFGPTLILAVVFVGLFYVVTRSPGWVLTGVVFTAAILVYYRFNPDSSPSSTLALRLDMWRDPWLNGRPNGDQLAMARWAMSAGGVGGSGIGAGVPGSLPAGHTDLIYAHLIEAGGWVGGVFYLTLLEFCVFDGMRVAALNRTPERVGMATALGLLLAGQAFVILGGTLGFFPLTGVVVPFLSFGKTGTIVLVCIVALIVRLGEDGHYAADTEELRELRGAVHHLRWGLFVLGAGFSARTFELAVVGRDESSLRGVVTTLGDGTPVVLHDPRLTGLASQVRRGSLLDRNGEVLAASATAGQRVNPLGDKLGTVLGPANNRLARAKWQVEAQLDARLRGWGDSVFAPEVWLGTVRGRQQVVFASASGLLSRDEQKRIATQRLAERGGQGTPRRVLLADPDYGVLLPIARASIDERAHQIAGLAADIDSRTVALSIDAKLQERVAAAARVAAARSKVGAAAIAVLNANTGEILARAQWPDFDPGGTAWMPLRAAAEKKFMGIYGAWSDKTGAHGVFQAGSVFKPLTALVAVREGAVSAELAAGECPTSAAPSFACTGLTDAKTSFTLPGWKTPIHDYSDGGARGEVDLIDAITQSSNVYFGQLALKLGPDGFRRLRKDGVEFGNPGLLAETDGAFTGVGEGGSRRLAQTGFGQGAGSWSVLQAARLIGAVANGGHYLRCSSTMEKSAPCERIELLPPGASAEPILAGMKGVMERGTGAKLAKVPGVRIYGKTGTADAPGTRDEAAWGIRPGQSTTPHSWFVAIAEGNEAPACAPTGNRFVVAAVVPHGGFGASAAGPLAVEAIRALQAESYLPPAVVAPAATSGAPRKVR